MCTPSARTVPGPQVRVRADRHVRRRSRACIATARVDPACAAPTVRVGQRGLRADRRAARRRACAPCRSTDGSSVTSGSSVTVGVDPGRGRIDDGDAGAHVRLEQPGVVDAVRRRELHPVVDAGGLGRRRGHRADRRGRRRRGCRSTSGRYSSPWALSRESRPTASRSARVVERVDRRRDLAHGQLGRARRPSARRRAPTEPSAPRGSPGRTRSGRRRSLVSIVAARRRARRRARRSVVGREQRRVAGQDDDRAGRVRRDRVEREPHGVPGAVLLVLHDRDRVAARSRRRCAVTSSRRCPTTTTVCCGCKRALAARTCPSSERPAKPCSTLGVRRLHPGALARREHDHRERAPRGLPSIGGTVAAPLGTGTRTQTARLQRPAGCQLPHPRSTAASLPARARGTAELALRLP